LITAFGGILVPALIFMAVNAPHPENWRCWAVPTTDIAFALGVLFLLDRGCRAHLTCSSPRDDLGAILIIATFYASDLSFIAWRSQR
jgi:NhaA family Na+:H+ antiporter